MSSTTSGVASSSASASNVWYGRQQLQQQQQQQKQRQHRQQQNHHKNIVQNAAAGTKVLMAILVLGLTLLLTAMLDVQSNAFISPSVMLATEAHIMMPFTEAPDSKIFELQDDNDVDNSNQKDEHHEVIPMIPISSPLTSDIRKSIVEITHHPYQRQIKIHFRPSNATTCPNPYIIGRLSGPALAMIQWEKNHDPSSLLSLTSSKKNHRSTAATTTTAAADMPLPLVGTYRAPITGQYFIELLGLFCLKLQFEDDFIGTCLEHYPDQGGRLTTLKANITVTTLSWSSVTSSSTADNNVLGYWVANNRKATTPLWTRYQPLQCRKAPENTTDRCRIPTSMDRFVPYRFVWRTDDAHEFLETYSEIMNGPTTTTTARKKICLFGSSHSRMMRDEFRFLLSEDMYNITNVVVQQFDRKFPEQIRDSVLDHPYAMGCTYNLIAVGQWSAGPRDRPPKLFPDWNHSMTVVIDRFQSRNRTLFLRPIHYNPLGDFKWKCPPIDWRSPPVIDGYNAILQSLGQGSTGISYLDRASKDIMAPMWDSAQDWCHYVNEASRQEATWILYELLSSSV